MPGRPFQKGQCGNPGGRPKAVQEIRELARAHCADAIAELARLAVKAKSEAARIALYANCSIVATARPHSRSRASSTARPL